MTTLRKTTANRANAQRSTGPRTAAGKQQACRNALKHGLAVPVRANAALSQEAAALAQAITGADECDPRLIQAAALLAEAAIDVLRVRQAKADLLNTLSLHAGGWQSEALGSSAGWEQLDKLDRYERRALSRRNTALRALDEVRNMACGAARP